MLHYPLIWIFNTHLCYNYTHWWFFCHLSELLLYLSNSLLPYSHWKIGGSSSLSHVPCIGMWYVFIFIIMNLSQYVHSIFVSGLSIQVLLSDLWLSYYRWSLKAGYKIHWCIIKQVIFQGRSYIPGTIAPIIYHELV